MDDLAGGPTGTQPQAVLLRHVSLPAGAYDVTGRSTKRKADWMDHLPGSPAVIPGAGPAKTPQGWQNHGPTAAAGHAEQLIGAHYGSGVLQVHPPQPPHAWPGMPLPAASTSMGPPCTELQGRWTAAKQPRLNQAGGGLQRTSAAPPAAAAHFPAASPLLPPPAAPAVDAAAQYPPHQYWQSAQGHAPPYQPQLQWHQQQVAQQWSQGPRCHNAWQNTPLTPHQCLIPPTPPGRHSSAGWRSGTERSQHRMLGWTLSGTCSAPSAMRSQTGACLQTEPRQQRQLCCGQRAAQLSLLNTPKKPPSGQLQRCA